MITRNRMKFMAPDAGGTAVAEPPPTAAPETSIGSAYTAALADAQSKAADKEGGDPTPPTNPEPPAKPAEKAAAAKEADKAEPPAKVEPTSALDAALADAPATEPKPEAPANAAADVLKELPETLPREGRGAHWEKARGAIDKLGGTVSQQSKTIAERDATIAQLKAAPPQSNAELETLRAENAQYKDALVAINVEYEPEHRKKYVEGRVSLIDKAASKLNAFGGKGELIKEALQMPEGRARNMAIKEALVELEPVEQNRVMQFVSDVEKLDDEKAEIMKDPQGAWDKLQKGMTERQKVAAQAAEDYKKTTFENVSKDLSKEIFLLREVDSNLPGATEHNAEAKAMREGAFKLLQPDAKPEALVKAAYWAHAGPKLDTILRSTMTELKAARAQLKEYEGAEPGFRGGKPPVKSSTEQKLEKPVGQLYREKMAELSGEN